MKTKHVFTTGLALALLGAAALDSKINWVGGVSLLTGVCMMLAAPVIADAFTNN